VERLRRCQESFAADEHVLGGSDFVTGMLSELEQVEARHQRQRGFTLEALVPNVHRELGAFIALIVVNCIILGRAEAFANKNPVRMAVADALGMGLGFGLALFLLGAVREVLGNLKAICENRGDSLRPEYAPLAKPEIRLVILVDVPSEKVFDALAAKDRLAAWATRDEAADVELRTGGLSAWEPRSATVAAVEPGRRLSMSWPRTGTATFDLEPKSSGTGVYFRHEGLPEDAQALRNLRGRWSSLLVDLKNYLEAGEVGFLESYEEQRAES